MSNPIELSKDSGWVTINGVHVHIGEDGRIDKGPSHMEGKTPKEVVHVAGERVSDGHRVGNYDRHATNDEIRQLLQQFPDLKPVAIRLTDEEMAKYRDKHDFYSRQGTTDHERNESIAKAKSVPPVIMQATEKGRYLLDGDHRLAVSAAKGEREVLAYVIPHGKAFRGSRMFYLSAPAVADDIKPALTLGQGFPTHKKMPIGGVEKDVPVAYFWKDAIATGEYVHPATKQRLSVNAERLKGLAKNFHAMRAAGIEVPAPKDHSARSEDNLGFVIDARVAGDRLQLLHQVIGEDAAMTALRNRCSLCIDPDYVDEKGKHWGDAFTHSAFTPKPVVTGMGEFTPFAASRDGEPETPIYYLSADNPERSPDMDFAKLREALGATAEIPDDKLLDQVRTLRTEHKSAAAKVTELSRTPAAPDPEALADRAEITLGKIDLAVGNGDLPPTIATKLKARVVKDGKPNVYQLSRQDGIGARPIDDVLELFKGEKLNPKAGSETGVQNLSRNVPGGEPDEAAKAENKSADDEVARLKAAKGI